MQHTVPYGPAVLRRRWGAQDPVKVDPVMKMLSAAVENKRFTVRYFSEPHFHAWWCAVGARSSHYKVEVDNARVRVLHIRYGPHEKSVMLEHPDAVAIPLTDGQVKFTLSDGKSR